MRTGLKVISAVVMVLLFLSSFSLSASNEKYGDDALQCPTQSISENDGSYEIQWEKDYGKMPFWSARYEGPQPVGDADNDGKNELLIGGRDPFMRVMKWDEGRKTYYEQAKIIDPVFGIGYSFMGFGSATGFSIADIDNDGENEIGGCVGSPLLCVQMGRQQLQEDGNVCCCR
ncbi:MAG: hypothetical protein FE043_03445 [Thermoplasmata archaeon]|nr:MAG: hypothetical protein FE043_03445 [Thermoplasmata archaeon]